MGGGFPSLVPTKAPYEKGSSMFTSPIGGLIGTAVTTMVFSLSGNATALADQQHDGPSDAMCIDARNDRGPVHPHPEINTVKFDCRAHGWIIRPRIVVGPFGHVRFRTMPTCINEDGSYLKPGYPVFDGPKSVGLQRHCFWNAHKQGNGRGSSYINDHVDGVTTVTWLHPHKVEVYR